MADSINILSENEEQLSDEDLLKYLDDNISEDEKCIIEEKLSNSSFENDAIDGLQQINNPAQLQKHVKELNKKLRQQLRLKKQRKAKRKIKDFQWAIVAILLLLFICVITYFFIAVHM